MAEVEILDVTRGDFLPQICSGGVIESPGKRHRQDHFALSVSGWVCRRDDEEVRIEATSEGHVVSIWDAKSRRDDISLLLSDYDLSMICGFRAVLSTMLLPPRFELRIEAVKTNSRSLVGTIHGRRSSLSIPQHEGLHPLLITTLGRTGSTLLMLLAGQHPQLVVHPPFPFEAHVAAYWASVFEGLASPTSYARSLAAGDTSPTWWAGHEPFLAAPFINRDPAARWLGGRSIENLGHFARHQITSFYEVSAAFQKKCDVRYFAEKQLPHRARRRIQCELFPTQREIFLVRDFRDMLASILAFNKKRGQPGFGVDVNNPNKAVRSLGAGVDTLLNAWRTTKQGALLVRYEDLVQQPQSTLEEVFRFLDLPASSQVIDRILKKAKTVEAAAQKQHQTSRDLLSSIGRWRNDLSAELREASNRQFADGLSAFGYAAE